MGFVGDYLQTSFPVFDRDDGPLADLGGGSPSASQPRMLTAFSAERRVSRVQMVSISFLTMYFMVCGFLLVIVSRHQQYNRH